ncbi:MAG: DUF1236 domain-containing protein [Mesorhizobium sp.]
MSIRTLLIATGASLLLAPVAASAQDVLFAPEDEVIVREYIVKQPRREIVIPDGYDVVVGEEIPEAIVIDPLDAPGLERDYEYIVIDERMVLVDPETRRVVHIIE